MLAVATRVIFRQTCVLKTIIVIDIVADITLKATAVHFWQDDSVIVHKWQVQETAGFACQLFVIYFCRLSMLSMHENAACTNDARSIKNCWCPHKFTVSWYCEATVGDVVGALPSIFGTHVPKSTVLNWKFSILGIYQHSDLWWIKLNLAIIVNTTKCLTMTSSGFHLVWWTVICTYLRT